MRALIWSIPLLLCNLLGACANSPYGRAQLLPPQAVSAVYSEVNMRLHLVTTADARYKCAESECDANTEFDLRVARLGERLADAAFELHPSLRERIGHFEFVIAEKGEPGTTSNDSGTIVIFAGTRELELSDTALAFILARELGHVIGSHHGENTATSIIVSVLAQVLLPVSGLLRVFGLLPGASGAAAASASTATAATATTTTAATAASFLGSRALIATYRPQQLGEADIIALTVMARLGYSPQETADDLAATKARAGDGNWPRDLHQSSEHVAQITQGPRPEKKRLPQLAIPAALNLTFIPDSPSVDADATIPQPRRQ